MLKLKKTSVKLQRASFSRIGILGVCFLVFIFINSCGFHLAEKKSWIGQAKSLRMEKIENHSRILGIDFLLKKELDFRILQYPESFFTKNLADLNLNILIFSIRKLFAWPIQDFFSEMKPATVNENKN